jgi:uncharacterized protein YeaO (DUF488 family)
MGIRTRRWNDPAEPGDGFRVLVARYRPRGVSRHEETWDAWWPDLGPSRALHAAFYGKGGPPLPFEAYALRYRAEMAAQRDPIRRLAALVTAGRTLTLLCSSACVDPARCHRTLLARMIEEAGTVRRRRPPPAR